MEGQFHSAEESSSSNRDVVALSALSDVVPFGVDVSFDVVDLAFDDCPHTTSNDDPIQIVAALPELSRALASKHQTISNYPRKMAHAIRTSTNKVVSTAVSRRGQPVERVIIDLIDAGDEATAHTAESTRIDHTRGTCSPRGMSDGKRTNVESQRNVEMGEAQFGVRETIHSKTAPFPSKRRRQHERDVTFDSADRMNEKQGCYNTEDRRHHFHNVHGIGRSTWNGASSTPYHRHHPQHLPPKHFQAHSTYHSINGKPNGEWSTRGASEREWFTRRHEMEALTKVQATKQRELDRQAVALEAWERELDEYRLSLETTYFDREKELEAVKKDTEVARQHKQVENRQRGLNSERDKLNLSMETGLHERNMLQTKQVSEIAEELAAVKTLQAQLEHKQTEETLELDSKRKQFTTEQLEHQCAVEAFQRERSYHLSVHKIRETELGIREDAQTSREKAWQETVAQAEFTEALKTKELDARAAQLEQQQTHLHELKRSLEIAQARHEDEIQGWTILKAQQVEEATTRHKQAMELARLKELGDGVEAQAKLQVELDPRAVVLKKHVKKFIPKDPPTKVRKTTSFSENGTHSSVRVTSNHPEVSVSNTPLPKKNQDNHFILIDGDRDKRKVKRSNFPPEQVRWCADTTAAYNAAAAKQAAQSTDYNCSLTEEAALEMQERLFRDAATKMRTQPSIRVIDPRPTQARVLITVPIFDIADRYPNHWTWKDPYAVLGLPSDSSVQLVKSQYRRLARIYHPDKSTDANTCAKFHAISTVYHNLVASFSLR